MSFHQRMGRKRYHLSRTSQHIKPIFYFVSIVAIISVSLMLSHTNAPPSFPKHRLKILPEEAPPHNCPSTRYPPLYIFSHLHKTGGNTLKRLLFTFAKRNNISLYHTCHPVIPDRPFTISAWWLNRPKKSASSTSLDCNLDQLRLNLIPSHNMSSIQFIIGHQHHGVHSLFPRRNERYFTFVRHPLYRKASHFFHFEQLNDHDNGASLVEYLLSRNSNYMTKRLATKTAMSELAHYFRERAIDVDPFAARAALTSAQTHLVNDFFFVGLHHRYTESVCVLFHILAHACRNGGTVNGGRSMSSYGHYQGNEKIENEGKLVTNFIPNLEAVERMKDNVRGRAAVAIKELPEEIKERVIAVEKHDMHLFRLAETLFEDRLKQYEQCRGVTPSSHF